MGQFKTIRVWITEPENTKDPGFLLPDDYVAWDPQKHRLYAMRGFGASLAVFNHVEDKWEGFFWIPETSSPAMFRAANLLAN